MITSNPRVYEVWLRDGRAVFGSTRNPEESSTHLAWFARVAQARSFVRAYNRKLREASSGS